MKLGIAFGEFGAGQHRPVLFHAIDDTDLVTVLEIFADASEVDASWDAMAHQFLARTDAGKHQQLRRVERAAAKNHFTTCSRLADFTCGFADIGVGPVEPLALEIFNPGGPQVTVKQHPGRQRVTLDVETIGKFFRHTQYPLTAADPHMVTGRQRHKTQA